MSRKQLLAWGKRWHYPFLVLGDGLLLRHGKTHYAQASKQMIQLASQRIERWNALIMPERIDDVIQQVDKMLLTCSADTTDSLIVERV